jgi:hypothetical protein
MTLGKESPLQFPGKLKRFQPRWTTIVPVGLFAEAAHCGSATVHPGREPIDLPTMNLLAVNRELRLLGSVALLLALVACGHPFEPPDRADRVADAEARYSAEMFDTLTWSSDDDRALAGNSVYVDKCRKCHGTLGAGDTEYAQDRGLDVPSLVQLDWGFPGGLESVRRHIFVGHENGMPTLGVAGLTPREIDGAAYYVIAQLRPEILQQD